MNISLRKSVRSIMLVALLLGCVLSLPAQQVTQEAALKKAEQFLGKASLNRRAPHKAPQLTLANNRDEFYVFNDKANGGYVIVSGEERMPDVLAYSYDSRFDADNMPCNMKAWLEGYAEQVKYLRTHPEASARRTTPERKNVDPMLTCWFHQSSPYWNKCPEVNGKHCYTGCVATAMAQIMYYWQRPKQTTDVIPGYTTSTHKIEMPEIPITTIDWDNMLGQYDSEKTYTKEQTDAISTLMLLCGTSAEMDYSPTGSGTSLGDAAKAFRKYFDYDDMLEYVSRSAYNTEDWEQLVYDELKSKRPVLYGGFSYLGGHAFVLDGYQDGYFHVNWGGGKGSESYVLMTDAEGWKGYTEGQDAVVGIQPASEDNLNRYAVLDNSKMTLYYDKNKSSRSGKILSHKDDWQKYAEEITECVIDKSFANLKQRNMFKYFCGLKNLKSIKGMKYLNTSEVTDMGLMFYGCESLTSLDVSGFKTDKVTNMYWMFYGCSSLTSLDLSGFNTENVTNMWGMFYKCSSLTSLDVSGFKTDKVTNMYWMFYGCSSLTSLDVSGFNTENVTNMNRMFHCCSGLTSLDVSGFKTDKVTDMWGMFDYCSSLITLDVSGFNTENVTNMGWMFSMCSGLTSLDLSGFNTENVTDMNWMFYQCSSLTSLDVSGFKTDKVTDMHSMFSRCESLTSLDVSGFKTDKVTNMESMFFECSHLTELDVSGFKTENVTNMEFMFSECSHLTELDVSGFKTENVTGMWGMFAGCSGLTSLDVSGFKTDNVMGMGMGSMFSGCSGLTKLDVSGFKTDKVVDMGWMFADCSGLTELNVSGFKTDNVTNMYCMFYNCSGLTNLDVSGFKTDNVTDMGYMFDYCFELSTIYASERWNMDNVEYTDDMFYGCSKIVGGEGTTYDPDHTNNDYARIDEGPSKPGYFTYKAPQFYTITYMVDDEEYVAHYLKVGVTITAEEEPTKEGYTFSGWSEIPETMPAHDVTVTGTFEKNIIMGDVNGDGVVNVTDIVATVNYIMEKPSDGFNKEAADLNGDGEINVTDIVKMVTIIMSGDGGSSRRAAATSGNLVISGHNIQLRNAENYIAAQFDINLSDGQSISDIVLNGSSNHDLHWKMIDASTCRVVVYSMTNTAFGVNGDNLFNIFINGGQRATISNELLIKAGNTTGIDAIRKESENGKVYDLNGRQVKTPRKGVYIINGKKVVVK